MTDPTSLKSFADFRALLAALPGPDQAAKAAAEAREPQLTKPAGSLGRLEEISAWLAAWQGRHPPRLDMPACVVFAGNHGVAAQGVSAFPAEVTVQMVANFQAGGAAINQLCRAFGTALDVQALDLDRPTRDFTQAPAMDEAECVAHMISGMAAVRPGTDVLCLGEMGIANSTPAAALCLALFGRDAAFWTGPGTGVMGAALQNKIRVVGEGVARHGPAIHDGLDALRLVGGRELAAIAGAVLAARLKRVPVLLDGFICTAAAAVLHKVAAGALDHCLIAHASAEPGHGRLAEALGKTPLFDLGMRLGEASGAALAVGVLKAAVACHTGMATFAEAGVSDKEE